MWASIWVRMLVCFARWAENLGYRRLAGDHRLAKAKTSDFVVFCDFSEFSKNADFAWLKNSGRQKYSSPFTTYSNATCRTCVITFRPGLESFEDWICANFKATLKIVSRPNLKLYAGHICNNITRALPNPIFLHFFYSFLTINCKNPYKIMFCYTVCQVVYVLIFVFVKKFKC